VETAICHRSLEENDGLSPLGQEYVALLQTGTTRLPDRTSLVPITVQELSASKKEKARPTEGQGRKSAVAVASRGRRLTPAESISALPTASARLKLLKPITWMHVPKTGTSMLNIFYAHPDICPLVPEGVKLPDNRTRPDNDLFAEYPPDLNCPGSFKPDRGLEIQARHIGLGTLYEDLKGHIVAMFRQPEQRLLSAYYDHQWRPYHSWRRWAREPRDAVEFAVAVQGCATKMIARQLWFYAETSNPCKGPFSPLATEAESDLAVQRLREGFGFVGLMDRWDLSVCLFHAKFGGDCHATEFSSTRMDRNSSHAQYDTSELRGFKDKVDGRLFEEAVRIFEDDTSRFGVSPSTCSESCWPRADF